MNIFNTTPERDVILLAGIPYFHPKPDYFYNRKQGGLHLSSETINFPILNKQGLALAYVKAPLFVVATMRRGPSAFHLPNIEMFCLN